jgi:pimeloyl-ACP methyl ester carboxylesterase
MQREATASGDRERRLPRSRVRGDVLFHRVLKGFRSPVVSTFALIHGGGGSAWDWHLVAPELRERGHDPVAVDLPTEDDTAGWWDYSDTVVEAVRDRRDLIVVGHSLGGFTAPLVCARRHVDLLVLVAGMIPSPGESFTDWWTNSGYEESGSDDVFYHDVPPELAAEARTREREQAEKPLHDPWPLEHWPDVPTRYLLCRNDRLFPAQWARRHARERLGIEPDEMDGGHYIALSRPRELADRLAAYAFEAA